MVRKHLTRREIVQEDRIHSALTGIYGWAARNFIFVGVALGLMAAALIGSYLWQDYQTERADEVQSRFTEALKLYHPEAPEEDSGGTLFEGAEESPSKEDRLRKALESFEAVASDYPDFKAGALARYYVGLIHRELGQAAEAKNALENVVNTTSDAEIQNLARHLLSSIAQSEQEYDEAARLLQEILAAESQSYPAQAVLFELGQNYEMAGNTEEALRFYRRLKAEYPSSQYSQEADPRIDQLQSEGNGPSVSQN